MKVPRFVLQPTTVQWLAVLTCVFAYAQISLGAVVRVSRSGLGCGSDWPLCHGQIIPPDSSTAIIEYAHRTVGAVTGMLIVLTLAVGWLTFRHSRPRILRLLGAATGLVVVEGLLGAMVVLKDLAGVLVLAHLGVALALIGILIAAAVRSGSDGAGSPDRALQRLTMASVGLTYVLLMSGAVVVATDADQVCRSWPLCPGGLPHDIPAVYTTLHRLCAAIFGLFILFTLVSAVWADRSIPRLRSVAAVTLVLLVVQIGIGYPTAVTGSLPLVDGLHVALATAVWSGVVATAMLALHPSTIASGSDTSGTQRQSVASSNP